uniref:Hyaluronidase n=1 Tax=Junco hyemalis TaxID=40217 RepID=A0A8C5J8H6_JUNHY
GFGVTTTLGIPPPPRGQHHPAGASPVPGHRGLGTPGPLRPRSPPPAVAPPAGPNRGPAPPLSAAWGGGSSRAVPIAAGQGDDSPVFRPKQLWGFYLFPDCYNHDYSKNKESYTGQCPDVEKSRNDQLKWLWKESMALYPSIYLDPLLDSTPNSRKFVRARVMEAMRISQKHHDDYSLPVFVYTRPTYLRKLNVLSQADLISTIGESAALGAAGAILWGDAVDTRNRELCQLMKNYLEGDLGRYIVNVTTAAELCSTTLCQGRGRCLRQDSHLRRRDADHPEHPLFWAEGQLSSADTLFLRTHFQCHCYQGWQGSGCQTRAGPRSHAPGPLAPLGLGVLLLLASWCYPPLD